MSRHKKEYRFLVVDDQELMLKLFRGILKAGGYKKIAYASTGKQALAIVKNHPVDMIIADVFMPNMNGVELLKLLRNNPLYDDIPFLVVSGELSEEGIIYAMEEGVDDYLIKPVSANQAVEKIEKIFTERSNPQSTRNKSTNVFRLKRLKKYDEAIALALRNLEIFENPALYLVLSECYLETLDFDNALKYTQKVLEIKDDSRAVFLLGKIYMAAENYELATEKFSESSRMNPLNTTRKIDIANTYIKSGLTNEAEVMFEALRASEVTDLDCVGIASAYLSFGSLEKAGAYLARVADPIPEMVPVFNRYAMELKKVKKYKECIKQYLICLQIDPNNTAILFNLGCMHFINGDVKEAIKTLEFTIELEPSFEDAKKMLDFMKAKRDGSLKKS